MMMYSVILCLIVCYNYGVRGGTPVVWIKDTSLQGVELFAAGGSKPVYSFVGVFYAEPPTANRRFAPPVTKKLPSGEYDATRHGPFCPQNLQTTAKIFPRPLPSEEWSEDCLHLDVYTPSLNPGARLAVMVYFHGGAFANGVNGYYDGVVFAAFQNVVVVTANYRLGALGFLSTEDEAAFGNFGLLDQQMALQWVHKHISLFGGDPNQVTIFGESAGAVSVALHLQSSLSRGFFRRAISQSGVAHSPVMMSKHPRRVAVRLAEKLGCPSSSSQALVECLRTKSCNEIVGVDMAAHDVPFMPFSPVVDGFFIEEDPVVALLTGKMNVGAELLIGVNNHEGGYTNLADRINANLFTDFTVNTFRALLQFEFQKFIPGDMSEIIGGIERVYGGKAGLTNESALLQLTEVLGDIVYVTPAIALANAMAAFGGKVFFYEYQHRMSCSRAPAWVRADHGDEEALVFGFPFLPDDQLGRLSFTAEETVLSHTLMTYWANFAKTGNPNGHGNQSDLPFWKGYSTQEKSYMKLDVHSQLASNLKPDKVAFWGQVMDSAHHQPGKDEL